MVKYRDGTRWPRGRGTLLQDTIRATTKLTKEILRDEERGRKQHARKMDSERVLDALGLPIRRAMVRRLRQRGAMSLSKLADPFRISLPATLKHVRLLEETGIVHTHKRGRVRICVYNPSAFKNLASYLTSQAALWAENSRTYQKRT